MKKILQILVITALITSGCSKESSQAQTIGVKAPDFSLTTLSNNNFTLSKHMGKVVFVFLFGNGCPHCISNGPNTQSGIYEIFKNDTNVVCIGVDVWDGNSNQVQSFKNRTGIDYELCVKGSALTSAYGTTYDRMLVIDQEGILRYKSTSNATVAIVNQAKDAIETALQGATGINDPGFANTAFSVYPNPVSDQATIQTDYEPGTSFDVLLTDLSGRLLLNSRRVASQFGQLQLDVSPYPAGMYYLQTRSSDRLDGTRLIIAK